MDKYLQLVLAGSLKEMGSGLKTAAEARFASTFAGVSITGVIMGFARLIHVFSLWITPRFAKKFGSGNTAKLGLFIVGSSLILISFFPFTLVYAILRPLVSFGFLLFIPSYRSVAQEILKSKREIGFLFGLLTSVSFFFGALGSLIPVIFAVNDAGAALRISGFFYILAGFFFPQKRIKVREIPGFRVFRLLRNRLVFVYFLGSASYHAYAGARSLIFPVYFGLLHGGVLIAMEKISYFLSPLIGKLSQTLGFRRTLILSSISLALVSLLVPFSRNFLIVFALYLILRNFFEISMSSLASLEFTSEERVQINSFERLAKAAVSALFTAFSGLVYTVNPFLFFAPISVIYLLVFLLMI